MKIVLFGITWAASQNFFILAPLLLISIFFFLWKLRRLLGAIRFLSASSKTKKLFSGLSFRRYIFKTAFGFVGLVFLFLALLRPQWDKKEQLVEQKGRDLFIAFDISRSMLVQDCKPNRLECAKEKVRELLKYLECERVGLILFSGSTCVQCPLTNDYSAFFMFLDQLDVETISSGTTAIDAAIKKALSSFQSMPARKNKLLILLTDGEDFSSNLAGVRAEAAQEGMTIFALGVGTPEGGPIAIFDREGNQVGHQKNQDGSAIISRLNEGILHNLAQQTGGTYLRMTADNSDIKALIKRIETFEKERFQDKEISDLQEKYPYFLVVSFICFALEWIL